jgi:hypothetical protein
MPNMLDVIRELKALQGKQNAGQATPADVAKIAELQDYMTGKKKPDAAPAGPPIRPPAGKPAAAAPAAPPPRAAAPAAAAAPPAPRPAAAPAAKPRAGEPDASAFALSLDADLMEELGEVDQGDDNSRAAATTFEVSEPGGDPNAFALDLAAGGIEPDDFDADESDAAKTTFAVDDEPVGKASDANPFALEIPEGLADLDLAEDNTGNVTHELAEGELDDAAVEDDPFKVKLKDDFAKALDKADAKGAGGAAPTSQMKGTPMVPDAQYEKLQATETSVVVQLRDGRIGKGVAGAFSPMSPQFTLNQLVAGKTPAAIKLEDCLTVRFVRTYNGGAGAATPFPAKPAPGPVTPGEKLQVQLLDGEKIVGTALAHKEGDSFMLIPVPGGNVKRMWISAKAVRAKTKLP